MKYYGKTDIGSRRYENQDCYGIYQILPGVTLCVVCDGMGGAAGGAVASRLALDTFSETVREKVLPDSPEDAADLGSTGLRFALQEAVEAANREVWLKAHDETGRENLDGMGTTLVALLIVDGVIAFSVNVGDSRMYEITTGGITQLTHDHSYVQHLVDIGKLTYDEARTSPVRNVITRAVGIGENVRADIVSVNADTPAPGTHRWLLLCTDGLCGCVDETTIQLIMQDNMPLDQKAERLVQVAIGNGGPDNITVLLVEL